MPGLVKLRRLPALTARTRRKSVASTGILAKQYLTCSRPDWYAVPGIWDVPDSVDPYSFIMLDYGKVLSDGSLRSILGTQRPVAIESVQAGDDYRGSSRLEAQDGI